MSVFGVDIWAAVTSNFLHDDDGVNKGGIQRGAGEAKWERVVCAQQRVSGKSEEEASRTEQGKIGPSSSAALSRAHARNRRVQSLLHVL